MAWGADSKTKPRASVAQLAKDFVSRNGKLVMTEVKFREWAKTHRSLAGPARRERAESLLALAGRFTTKGGPDADDAVAQLIALAADLLGSTTAKR